MSVVKSNAHQVGQSATAANNFTLYQPSTPDGTVRLGVGNAGATTADVITASSTGVTIPSVSSNNTFGFKNRIINGGMVIDQRNAGASVANGAGSSYSLDRWKIYGSQASKFTVRRNAGSVTPPVGYSYYLGVTSSSAYSVGAAELFQVYQNIEAFNIADLGWGAVGAKSVTLSFQVYSSLTGTFSGFIQNNAGNRSYPFSYSISSANTWTPISVTISGDTTGTWFLTSDSNGVGLTLALSLGIGSNYNGTAGAWAAGDFRTVSGSTSVVGTNGATFYITGVQLEVGAQATSFDFRSYGQELTLCQRYYWQGGNGWAGVFNTGTTARFSGAYPVQMRTAPTVSAIAAPTALNPTVSESQTGSQTTGFAAPASGGSIDTLASSKIQFGGFSSGADGRPSVLTNSPLSFSAEL